MEEIRDGDTVWRFDRDFLESKWTCLWGRGCLGIGPEPAEHLGLGCCSIGADLGDEDEARMISALAATLDPVRFERHAEAGEGGIFSDGTRTHTRVVCWQLPIKVDWSAGADDTEVATVHRWTRHDWGTEGETMAWCCTEGSLAYVAERPVVESFGAELQAIVGSEVYVELRRRMKPH
jgi:hypothetical protein